MPIVAQIARGSVASCVGLAANRDVAIVHARECAHKASWNLVGRWPFSQSHPVPARTSLQCPIGARPWGTATKSVMAKARHAGRSWCQLLGGVDLVVAVAGDFSGRAGCVIGWSLNSVASDLDWEVLW
jgi:hypothetical protein